MVEALNVMLPLTPCMQIELEHQAPLVKQANGLPLATPQALNHSSSAGSHEHPDMGGANQANRVEKEARLRRVASALGELEHCRLGHASPEASTTRTSPSLLPPWQSLPPGGEHNCIRVYHDTQMLSLLLTASGCGCVGHAIDRLALVMHTDWVDGQRTLGS
jgi:hypothetical protein